MQDGLLGAQGLGGPPVDGEAALNVVDEQGDANHDGAAENHDGDEEPAEGEEAAVDDGEQGGGAGGWVDGLGEGHDGGGRGTGNGAADVLDAVKVVTEEEELRDGDANDRRQQLAEEGIARLREGGLNGVEFEDGGCALGSVRGTAGWTSQVEVGNLRNCQQLLAYGAFQTREYAWTRLEE